MYDEENLKFEYVIELKEGYKPVMSLEDETTVKLIIEAPNRVTADRMVSAMLKGASNVTDISGVCISD